MTRTAVRHTLPALAAVALVAAFAVGPASAQSTQIDPPSLNLSAGWADTNSTSSKQKAPKGLATHPRSQRNATTHYEFRWWQDYSNGGR